LQIGDLQGSFGSALLIQSDFAENSFSEEYK